MTCQCDRCLMRAAGRIVGVLILNVATVLAALIVASVP